MVPCWFLTQKKGLGKMFVYMDAQCYTSSFGKNGAQSNSYLSTTATFYNTHASRALLLLPMRYFICKPQGVAKVFSCGKGGYERVDSQYTLSRKSTITISFKNSRGQLDSPWDFLLIALYYYSFKKVFHMYCYFFEIDIV